jgi:hypothetical protein
MFFFVLPPALLAFVQKVKTLKARLDTGLLALVNYHRKGLLMVLEDLAATYSPTP